MSLPPPTERQARLIWFAVTSLSIAILVALLAGLVWGLGRVLQVLSPVVWPLAIAMVLAYLLDPVVDLIERRGASRPRAILCVFAIALALLGGFLGCIVPQLVEETNDLAHRIPEYSQKLQGRVEGWIAHPPKIVLQLLNRDTTTPPTIEASQGELVTNQTIASTSSAVILPGPAPVATNAVAANPAPLNRGNLETATSWLATYLPKVGSWLFGQVGKVASWLGVLAGLALIPVYAFYFLLEKEPISARWTDYLPVRESAFKTELVFIITSVNNYLIAFFRGQVLVAICDGILYGAGFLIIRLPYAVLIGAAAMLLTIVPFLGAIIILIVAMLIAVVQFGDWTHPLLVLAVFAVVQTLEGLVISPRIMGGRVGLHPVTLIVAVMVGTTLLGGILGGILAIPLTAALRVLMFRYVWKAPATETLANTES
jgi:predicted PurR-regulated permease PerM